MNDITRQTCDGYHMTVVLLDHRRQEFTDHPEVRYGIDFKSLADEVLRAVKDGVTTTDAGVVD